jgi:hypothetical protein
VNKLHWSFIIAQTIMSFPGTKRRLHKRVSLERDNSRFYPQSIVREFSRVESEQREINNKINDGVSWGIICGVGKGFLRISVRKAAPAAINKLIMPR